MWWADRLPDWPRRPGSVHTVGKWHLIAADRHLLPWIPDKTESGLVRWTWRLTRWTSLYQVWAMWNRCAYRVKQIDDKWCYMFEFLDCLWWSTWLDPCIATQPSASVSDAGIRMIMKKINVHKATLKKMYELSVWTSHQNSNYFVPMCAWEVTTTP